MALPHGTTSANQISYATGIATYLSQVYLWDPAYALSADDAVYEKLFRDPVIAGAMDQLQRLIVGHDWSFEAAEDSPRGRQLASLLEGLTKQQKEFPVSLYNLARAHLVGATWGLITPERRVLRLGDGKPRTWTVIANVRDVDKRRFRLTQQMALGYPTAIATPPEKGSTARELDAWVKSIREKVEPKKDGVDREGYSAGEVLGNFRWEFHRGWNWKDSSSMWWAPLEAAAPLDRWILYTPDTSERGLGYGYGMADDLYFYYWAKQRVMMWGLQGLERWGQGFLYAKVKSLRNAEWAKGMSQSQALTQTVTALRQMRAQNVAAVDEDTDLTLLDMPATAAVEVREWIAYFDREIVKRILAALQPTGGGDGSGSFASAKVEEGSQDAMTSFLRCPLEEKWTATSVRFLIDHNRENLAELGLLESAEGWGSPRLRLRGKEVRKIDDVVKVFTLARDLQMPIRKEDFYSWTGLPAPNEEDGDESVVTFAQPMRPGALGGEPGGDLEVPGPGDADPVQALLDLDAAVGRPGVALTERDRAAVGERGGSVAEAAA